MKAKNTIIFTQDYDHSSSLVMDWLDFYGASITRINGEDLTSEEYQVHLELSDETTQTSLYKQGVDVFAKKVNRLWVRRDAFQKNPHCFDEDHKLQTEIERHFRNEARALKRSLFRMIDTPTLGDYFQMNVEKTDLLIRARNAGFSIPASLICSSKQSVLQFMKKQGQLITKPLAESIHLQAKSESVLVSYTEAITEERVKELPETFFPSLFQEQIDKAYELRVFYLDGSCYSMAIFSQLDQQTSVDFRKYNTRKGNRKVPYKLPEHVEESIAVLMKDIQLDTGSLDIIRAHDGRYVFLEVNPVGQFGMVSSPCNYHLEEKIALRLLADQCSGETD